VVLIKHILDFLNIRKSANMSGRMHLS